MSNIAAVLKTEVSRIVRKELRAEFASTKKAISSYRTQIAELKRQVKTLEKSFGSASRNSAAEPAATPADSEAGVTIRFSAKSLATQRKRLGLSASQTAKLLGVSVQSVANWEKGTSRPREKQLAAIAGLRQMGKKEVAASLEQLDAS